MEPASKKEEVKTTTTSTQAIKSPWDTNVLSREVAADGVNDWLDHKKVKQKKREDYEDNIEDLIGAFQSGQLVLNDDHSITMHLIFPKQKGQVNIESLTFKPRITQADKRPYMKKVKPGDIRGNLVAIGCALTGMGTGIIESLDTEDFEVMSAIAFFFF